MKEAEISETFSLNWASIHFTVYQIKEIRVILLRSATAFIFTQTLKNLNCPELWIPFIFSKRNSFKKAQKQVVTTKLFMNVHFCSLGMKTYRFQLVKSQKLPCRNNYYSVYKISFKQNWPPMILIEVTY